MIHIQGRGARANLQTAAELASQAQVFLVGGGWRQFMRTQLRLVTAGFEASFPASIVHGEQFPSGNIFISQASPLPLR
jgi:hypothetical protein